jgi:hypothetical protein
VSHDETDGHSRMDSRQKGRTPHEEYRALLAEAGAHAARASVLLDQARNQSRRLQLSDGETLTDAARALQYATARLTAVLLEVQQREASSCFPLDARVATPVGDRLLESVKPGQVVWGYNDRTRAQTLTTVSSVSVHDRVDVSRLEFAGGGTMSGTASHPVLTTRGWRRIRDVKRGDLIWTRISDGSVKAKRVVGLHPAWSTRRVGSLTTGFPGTYFIDGVVVHSFVWLRSVRSALQLSRILARHNLASSFGPQVTDLPMSLRCALPSR